MLVALLSALLPLGGPARAATFADAAGLHVEAVQRIDDRELDVTVSTAALGRAVHVRLLLPSGYDASRRRFPVLYLFHGTSGRASDWTTNGDVEAATAGLPVIVVMPDAGFDGNGGGWFTNWVDTTTALGASQWETFHVDQLIPWVDANLRTVADRRGRAVAGLSQGGFGSMTYAARHPDLFASVASFSGAPDIDWNPAVAAGATVIIEGTALGLDGVQPEAMFGSRLTNEINWQGHDPADLVTNLRGVDTWLFTAPGVPGQDDPGAANPASWGFEAATHGSTISFVQRAQSEAVPVHLVDRPYGTHTWPYWAQDLREYLVPLMATFAAAPAPPPVVSYQSVEPAWREWGWDVSFQRQARQQLTALTGASRSGFTLQGTGVATVTTPPQYRPRSLAQVTIAGLPSLVRVGNDGRLRLTVPLSIDVVAPAIIGVPVVSGTATTVTIAAP